MRIQGTKYCWGIVVLVLACSACAWAQKPVTLAYDGFIVANGPGSYLEHSRPYGQTPSLGVSGFDPELGWRGNTVFYHFRTSKLRHNLLEASQGGSLGQWARQGVSIVHRPLALPPSARSGVYTFCLLVRPAVPNDKHSVTAMGIGPQRVKGKDVDQVRSAGLALGIREDTLCVFAGGSTLPLVDNYQSSRTYLLMAEMTARADGPELIRGFWALDGQNLVEARFNSQNGGKGAPVETWTRPEDFADLELFASDPALSAPVQASPNDVARSDFVTWDEVRLLDGPASVPVPADGLIAPVIRAAPAPPPPVAPDVHGLVAYWPFDEGDGVVAHDAAGGRIGRLQRCSWIDDGVRGCALRLQDPPGMVKAPSPGGAVSVAPAAPLSSPQSATLTLSAWVRGGQSLKGRWAILTCELAGGTRLSLAIAGNKLWLEHGQSRRVADGLTVGGDNQWHHVAATVKTAAKDADVVFFVDGKQTAAAAAGGNEASPTLQDGSAAADTYAWRLGGQWDKADAPADIDDVGIFDRALTAGQVQAIHSMALTRFLRYDLDQVNGLIELHAAAQGSVKIGNKTWKHVKGLKSDLGKVISADGKFSIKLAADGSGVQSN
ncbi:MAG: LamG domain-containing protein [Planctomycetaceae bacterium]|nr:LamG domain-containing protein [Planctomycetaceae bacterium]